MALDFLLETAFQTLPKQNRVPIIVELPRIATDADVQELAGIGFIEKHRFKLAPFVSGELRLDFLPGLLELDVARNVFLNKKNSMMLLPRQKILEVQGEKKVKRHLVPSIAEKMGASKLYEQGFKGKGIKVAVCDTGVDSDHPALKEALEKTMHSISDNDEDYCGHGTHVISTIAGRETDSPLGKFYGVAPEARIVSVKVLDDSGSGSDESVMQGIELAAAEEPRIISMSLGGLLGMGGRDALSKMINQISEEKNILFSIAAGNSFIWGSVGSPASAKKAIAVGSHSLEVPQYGLVSSFSSKGPTATGVKPDVAAFGGNLLPNESEYVYAAYPPTAEAYDGESNPKDGFMGLMGTSMATPVFAGALALFLEATNSTPTSGQVKTILSQSCEREVLSKDNRLGWGRVKADKMVEAAEKGVAEKPLIKALAKLKCSTPKILFSDRALFTRLNLDVRELIGGKIGEVA